MGKKKYVIYNHPENFVMKEDGSLYSFNADSIDDADEMLWTLEEKLVEDGRIEEHSILLVVEVDEDCTTTEEAMEELYKVEGDNE